METITKSDIIDIFMEKNDLTVNDLVNYLEFIHDYECYKDSRFDN